MKIDQNGLGKTWGDQADDFGNALWQRSLNQGSGGGKSEGTHKRPFHTASLCTLNHNFLAISV